MTVAVQSSPGRRFGFTLVEIMVVMWAMGILLLLGAVLLGGTFRVRQAATTSVNYLNARSVLAERFRADVGHAVAAPVRADGWTAGPTCLLLRGPDGRHVAYRWTDGRLERLELPGAKSAQVPVGTDGTEVEFVRPTADRRVVAIRVSSPARLRSPAATLEISAALGGDYR